MPRLFQLSLTPWDEGSSFPARGGGNAGGESQMKVFLPHLARIDRRHSSLGARAEQADHGEADGGEKGKKREDEQEREHTEKR